MLPDYAHEWYAQISAGYEKLEAIRTAELRNMTEQDAARIFDQLEPPRPFEIRPSSGLVEQQRLFRKLLQEKAQDD